MLKKKEKLTILIIEDNPMFMDIAREVLDGHSIKTATTAKDGIAAFNKHSPDITFIDIGLPDESGHEVLRKIKEIDPTCFVMMLTASRAKQDIEQAILEGTQGYVIKPFSREQMNRCLEQYLMHRKKVLAKNNIGIKT